MRKTEFSAGHWTPSSGFLIYKWGQLLPHQQKENSEPWGSFKSFLSPREVLLSTTLQLPHPHSSEINLLLLITKSFQSCPTLWDAMAYSLPGSSVHGILQERIQIVLPCPLQGIFLTQGSNLGVLHYRQILYHLSSKKLNDCLREDRPQMEI